MLKKLLISALVTIVVGMGVASAADKAVVTEKTTVVKTTVVAPVVTEPLYNKAGKFGLGYQETFGTGDAFGTTLGELSLKLGINKFLTAQLLYGMNITSKSGPKTYEVGGRLLANIVEKHNSVLYTGLGVGFITAKGTSNVYRFNLPVGVEFSFAGLPELGFSAETGLVYDYVQDSGAVTLATVGGNVGGSLGLGVHYYF